MSFLWLSAVVVLCGPPSIDAKSCRDIVDMKLHPIDCCAYPRLYETSPSDKTCANACQQAPEAYCARVCFLSSLKIFVDKKFKIENLKNLFTASGDEAAGMGNVGDKWTSIVNESIKTCVKEHSVTEAVAEDQLSMVVFDLINCVRRLNFVACPDLDEKKADCSILKEAVKECDKSTEKMLFGVFHEDRKQDMHKGGMALPVGK